MMDDAEFVSTETFNVNQLLLQSLWPLWPGIFGGYTRCIHLNHTQLPGRCRTFAVKSRWLDDFLSGCFAAMFGLLVLVSRVAVGAVPLSVTPLPPPSLLRYDFIPSAGCMQKEINLHKGGLWLMAGPRLCAGPFPLPTNRKMESPCLRHLPPVICSTLQSICWGEYKALHQKYFQS